MAANMETDLDTAESRINYADLIANTGLRGAGGISGLRVGGGGGLGLGGGGYRNLMLGGGTNRMLGQSRAVNAAATLAAASKANGVVVGGNAAPGALGATGAAGGAGGLLTTTDYDDYGGITAPAINNRRNTANLAADYADTVGVSGYGAGGGTTGILNRNYGGGGGGTGYGSSGYGGGGGGYAPVNLASGYGPGVCEDKGLNPVLVLATLAAAAVAFALIYRQVTAGGRKLKKPPTSVQDYVDILADLVWSGE